MHKLLFTMPKGLKRFNHLHPQLILKVILSAIQIRLLFCQPTHREPCVVLRKERISFGFWLVAPQ